MSVKTKWSDTIIKFTNNLIHAQIEGSKEVICPVFGTKHKLRPVPYLTPLAEKKLVEYHGHTYYVSFVKRLTEKKRYVSTGIVFSRPNYSFGQHIPIMMAAKDFSEIMTFDVNGVPDNAKNKDQPN
jgi:hypothetical protein